jgi:hypothetical protein
VEGWRVVASWKEVGVFTIVEARMKELYGIARGYCIQRQLCWLLFGHVILMSTTQPQNILTFIIIHGLEGFILWMLTTSNALSVE